MGIYDYRCSDCSTKFEKQSPMDKRNESKCCPDCGGYNTKLIISSGVAFGDPYRMGRLKASDSFRDTLRDIKKEHPNSTINVD